MRLWDAHTGDPLVSMSPDIPDWGAWRSVPTGDALASASLDETVRLWPVTVTPQMLCDKLAANMSRKQWRDWVSPDIDYIAGCPGLPIPADGAN